MWCLKPYLQYSLRQEIYELLEIRRKLLIMQSIDKSFKTDYIKRLILTLFLYISVQLVEHGYTTATSSSTYTNYIASRAVDGDVSQDVSRCSHTDDKRGIKEAWLRVDLKKKYSIKSVKFWNRNDGISFMHSSLCICTKNIKIKHNNFFLCRASLHTIFIYI